MKFLLSLICILCCSLLVAGEPVYNDVSPVTGAHINAKNPPVTFEYDGAVYGFANPIEVSKFKINPRRYLKKFQWHSEGATLIPKEVLKKWLASNKSITIVDALKPEYFTKARIKNAINIPSDHVNHLASSHLPNKNAIIVTYCYRYKCHASTKAAVALQKLGYKNVYDYKGGFVEWKKFYPNEIDETPIVVSNVRNYKESCESGVCSPNVSVKVKSCGKKLSSCSKSKWGSKKLSGCSTSKCSSKKLSSCSTSKCGSKKLSGCSTSKCGSKKLSGCSTSKCGSKKLSGCSKSHWGSKKKSHWKSTPTGCSSTPEGCCGETGCKDFK